MDCLFSARQPLLRGSVSAFCHACRRPICRDHFFPPGALSIRKQNTQSRPCRYMTTNNHAATQNSDGPSDGSDGVQAQSLSGYYADILKSASRSEKRTPETPSDPPPAMETEPAPTTEPLSPKDRMSIVFGSRLASPGYRSTRYTPAETAPKTNWTTINGVAIPPKPEEPDNCCMSGCAHCVWDDYGDETEKWARRLAQAKARGDAKNRKTMLHMPRPEVDSASISMDDDGGGSETNWSLPDESGDVFTEDLFASIPVGIREFMKTEKRLRQERQQAGITT